MHRKVFLFTGVVLLVLVCLSNHAQAVDEEEYETTTHDTTHHTTKEHTTHHTTAEHTTKKHTTDPTDKTTKTKKTTKKRKNNYGGGSYGYGSKYNKGRGDDDTTEVLGDDGVDPRKNGQDYGDFGPVRGKKRDSMLSSLNVWISSGDDWKHDGSDSDGDDDPKGYRNKRSYKKVKFPVKRVKNYRQFPIQRFPPLISIFPWVPIFYDKLTYQTIIFSPTGGIYIIPPLINFYGQRFAVAQLIKWGYASLVSSGAPVAPGVDVAPLVGPPAAGGVAPAAGPTYDSTKARFTGGVKTDFRNFKPQYSQTIEEGGEPVQTNYGADKNYGGTGQQQVYAQGGAKYPGGY